MWPSYGQTVKCNSRTSVPQFSGGLLQFSGQTVEGGGLLQFSGQTVECGGLLQFSGQTVECGRPMVKL